MAIYTAINLHFPPWLQKVLVKIFKAFLWSGMETIQGGKCMVAWSRVTRSVTLGGLGVLFLNLMGRALRLRWLWLSRTNNSRTWAALPLHEDDVTRVFFKASICCEVGSGSSILFWLDPWVDGRCLSDLTPELFAVVAPRARR
jgi:hypothetical protein